jgi:hypothetical protein
MKRFVSFFRKLAEGIKHLVTSKDGETYAPSRVYWLAAAVTQLFLSIWSTVVQAAAFSSTDFGTGMGLILVAGGVGVWITRKTEPGQ